MVPQEGDAASRLKSFKVQETPSTVKAALSRLLGSQQEAAKGLASSAHLRHSVDVAGTGGSGRRMLPCA